MYYRIIAAIASLAGLKDDQMRKVIKMNCVLYLLTVQLLPPTDTVVSPANPRPVRVTIRPPSVEPVSGMIPDTWGTLRTLWVVFVAWMPVKLWELSPLLKLGGTKIKAQLRPRLL